MRCIRCGSTNLKKIVSKKKEDDENVYECKACGEIMFEYELNKFI